MPVAWLQQSADVTGCDETSHSHSPSGVSFSVQEEVYRVLHIFSIYQRMLTGGPQSGHRPGKVFRIF